MQIKTADGKPSKVLKLFGRHIATDSRDVRPGGAFVALEGEKTDGHNYIKQALDNGAELIVVRTGKRPEYLSEDLCIELARPETDLAIIAGFYLLDVKSDKKLKDIIAVTGSVGKTTTRETINKILSKKFKVHSAENSFNTRIGCMATVLAMPQDAEILLMEFGANHPEEIADLAALFPPTTAIITQVAPVHLEGFKNIQGVLNAKMEITQSKGLKKFLYNADNELLKDAALNLKLDREFKKYAVGNNSADFKIKNTRFDFDLKSGMPLLKFKLNKNEIQAAVWGEHNAYALAFAAAVGNLAGISPEECAEILRGFEPLDGRGKIYKLNNLNNDILIDDAYNANPASMRASLETFIKIDALNFKKIAVLGEMREMGDESVKYHAGLNDLINKIDVAVLVGETWPKAIKPREGVYFVESWQDALKIINNNYNNAQGRFILVKGSHGTELGNLVNEFVNN